MKRYFTMICAGIASAMLFAPLAQAQLLQADAILWYMSPEGTAAFGVSDLLRTGADLDDDLGVGGGEFIPAFEASFGGMHRIGVGGFQFDLSGDNVASRGISFAGIDFGVSERLQSEAEALFFNGYYRFTIDNGVLAGGIEAGGQYADLAAGIQSERIGTETAETEVVIPYAGLYAEGSALEWLSIRGGFHYSSWAFGDIEASYSRFDISARIHPIPFATLGLGYRNMSVDVTDGDVDVDLTLSGPMIFAGLQF